MKKWDQFTNFQKTLEMNKKNVICPKVERVVSSNNHIDFKMEIKFLWDISHHL